MRGASVPVRTLQPARPFNPEPIRQTQGDTVHFGAIDPNLMPPTRVLRVRTGNNKTLNLRQWWQKGETAELAESKKAPVFLFVHGLSGRTEWMSPLVQELMAKPIAGTHAFYGLDIPRVGQHDYGEGLVDDWSELVKEIKEAAMYLKEKHGGPVYPIGLSLGALLTSQAIAESPTLFTNPTLLAPAYKPHRELVSVEALGRAIGRFITHKFQRRDHEAIPFRQKQPAYLRTVKDGFSDLQIAIHKEKESATDRVEKLTMTSYLKMLKFMYVFRHYYADKIPLPVRMFATETDDLVDVAAIKTAFDQMPARHENMMMVFKKAAHDLINDPVNPQIAASIEEMLRLQRQKAGYLKATEEK